MKFNDKEFNNLYFPVHKVSSHFNLLDKETIKEFPVFKRLYDYDDLFVKEFEELNLDLVLRYIFYLYDINTPLRTIDVMDGRKAMASKLAGFKLHPKEKKYPKPVLDMMLCRNERVNRMIIQFCLFFHMPRYIKLVAFENAYEKDMELLMMGTHDDKTLIRIDRIEKEMDEIISLIFSGDRSQELSRTIYLVMEEERLELSPERIVMRIKDGKNSVNINPYRMNKYI